MLKKIIGFTLVQLVFVSSSFAISVKSASKFYFNDQDGEQISYVRCTNLPMQDEFALKKLTDRADNHEVAVDGLIVKKERISVMYTDENGRHAYEFDSKKGDCDLSL